MSNAITNNNTNNTNTIDTNIAKVGDNSIAMATPELSVILSLARKAIEEQDKAETAMGRGQQRLAYCVLAFHSDLLIKRDTSYIPEGWRDLYSNPVMRAEFTKRLFIAVLGEPTASPNAKSTDAQRSDYKVYASKKTMLTNAVSLACMLGLCQAELKTGYNPVLHFDNAKGWFKVPGEALCPAQYEPNKHLAKLGMVHLDPKAAYRIERGADSDLVYASIKQLETATTNRHDMVSKAQAVAQAKVEASKLATQAAQAEQASAASVSGASAGQTAGQTPPRGASQDVPHSFGDVNKMISEVARIMRENVKETRAMTPKDFAGAWNDLVYINSMFELIRDTDHAATTNAKARAGEAKRAA